MSQFRIIESTDGQHVGEVLNIDLAVASTERAFDYGGRHVSIDTIRFRNDGKIVASNGNYTVVLEAYS
jgi:sporulation protein YlmC with PRC-barrel domain